MKYATMMAACLLLLGGFGGACWAISYEDEHGGEEYRQCVQKYGRDAFRRCSAGPMEEPKPPVSAEQEDSCHECTGAASQSASNEDRE